MVDRKKRTHNERIATLENEAADKTQTRLDCLVDRKCCEFLDAQGKNWGTSCGKAQLKKSVTKCEKSIGIVSKNTAEKRSDERQSKDQPRADVTHSNTESRNDQRKFRVIPVIEGRVPHVKRLDERTQHTYQQQKHCDEPGSAGNHAEQVYTLVPSFLTWNATRSISQAPSDKGSPSLDLILDFLAANLKSSPVNQHVEATGNR